jgi:exopolyphosphatase / guanosine-5'-triphosphate,3'-diphosphate pyrophosphatase
VPNVAAIDIGTNSVRLLIADERGVEIERPMRITRLGQGVDVQHRLSDEAIARTAAVLEQYRRLADAHGVTRLRATATSASRDAANRDDFFDVVERVLGVRPELLAGEEEARLSFVGATAGLAASDGPFLIIDVGGGSTELVLGTSRPEVLVSLQLGCVRMTERHLKSDPPTPAELRACVADIERELDKARTIESGSAKQVVGLAGTVTALAGMQLGLEHYDAKLTHHSRLTLSSVEASFDALCAATIDQRRSLLAEPARAEVIVGGAAVLVTIMRRLRIAELQVSERDILDGLAASLLA